MHGRECERCAWARGRCQLTLQEVAEECVLHDHLEVIDKEGVQDVDAEVEQGGKLVSRRPSWPVPVVRASPNAVALLQRGALEGLGVFLSLIHI